MALLNRVNLYKINQIKNKIVLENILGTKEEILSMAKNDFNNLPLKGDIVLLFKENKKGTLLDKKAISYPVKKVKGRFSDVKEYVYLKMKVLYDFNLHYLGKKEIESTAKDPDHIEFEKLMDQNQEKIKELITYNSDENVEPFNHTNYEIADILNSKKIFRQEIGEKFDWSWSLMEIYQLDEENFVSFKQSSYFRERQRGEFFDIRKKAVDFMRDFEDDKDDFLD